MHLFLIGFIAISIFLIAHVLRSKKWKQPKLPVLSTEQRALVIELVPFYNTLNKNQKVRFEFKTQEFLENVIITPVDTQLDEKDRIMIAASAVIPVFNFPHWQYINLKEVILYPKAFNKDFEREGNNNRTIMGMVGTGYMEGKMILSKEALHHGFWNETDKRNTAIHEFVHLIDGADGAIDGIPEVLMEKQYIMPWLDLIQTELSLIQKNKSDIDDYALTNNAEFFAVAAEYFFERPQLFKKKHPQIYKLMHKAFKTTIE